MSTISSTRSVVKEPLTDDLPRHNGDHQKRNALLGVSLVTLAGVLSALFVAASQQVSEGGYNILTIITVVAMSQLPVNQVLISATRTNYRPSWHEAKWLVPRISTLMLGNMCMMLTAVYIPLGDTAAIHNSTSVFAMLFGRLFLGEKCKLFEVIFLALTLAGGFLVAQPDAIFNSGEHAAESATDRLLGSAFGVATAVCHALTNVVQRHAFSATKPPLISLYTCIVSILVYSCVALGRGETVFVCGAFYRTMIIVCSVSIPAMMMAYNFASRFITAGLGTLVVFGSYLAASFCIQLMQGIMPNRWTVIGTTCIFAALVGNFGLLVYKRHNKAEVKLDEDV